MVTVQQWAVVEVATSWVALEQSVEKMERKRCRWKVAVKDSETARVKVAAR